MLPDLSFRNQLTAILILFTIPVLLAAIIILSVSVYKKTNLLPGDSEQIKKVSELLKLADSIRDSSPDSALAYYNKSIILLQRSAGGKEKMHHLSEAYYGIAVINSTNRYYKAALQNDSIAMSPAKQVFDKQLIAKKTYTQSNIGNIPSLN